MAELINTEVKVKKVYDLGNRGSMTLPLGGDYAVFAQGVHVTDNAQHQEWIEAWIKGTGNVDATVADYDELNPRHNPTRVTTLQGQNVINGMQHSDSYKPLSQQPDAITADNQLAAALLNGTADQLLAGAGTESSVLADIGFVPNTAEPATSAPSKFPSKK